MNSLSDDVVELIIFHLNVFDALATKGVSKQWKNAVRRLGGPVPAVITMAEGTCEVLTLKGHFAWRGQLYNFDRRFGPNGSELTITSVVHNGYTDTLHCFKKNYLTGVSLQRKRYMEPAIWKIGLTSSSLRHISDRHRVRLQGPYEPTSLQIFL
jgi:hypothetical protein